MPFVEVSTRPCQGLSSTTSRSRLDKCPLSAMLRYGDYLIWQKLFLKQRNQRPASSGVRVRERRRWTVRDKISNFEESKVHYGVNKKAPHYLGAFAFEKSYYLPAGVVVVVFSHTLPPTPTSPTPTFALAPT